MSAYVAALNPYSTQWLALVAAVLWQSTLVVIVVAVAAWILRSASPAVRYWLWQIAAIKLLVLPLWSVSLPVLGDIDPPTETRADESADIPFDVETVATSPSLRNPAGTPRIAAPEVDRPSATLPPVDMPPIEMPAPPATWTSWLMAAWMGVLVLLGGQLVWQRLRLGRLLRQCKPAEAALCTRVDAAAAALDLRRRVAALVSPVAVSPFACGVWSPKIVLGRAMLADLAPRQLRSVLLHELAHHKRLDLLWGWIPELARRIYFFHPLAYWIDYRIRLERELACDQLAIVAGGNSPAEYADTLVRVVSAAAGERK